MKKNQKKMGNNSKSKIFPFLIVLGVVFLIGLVLLLYVIFFKNSSSDNLDDNKELIIKDKLEYEIGSSLPKISDYFDNYDSELVTDVKYFKDGEIVDPVGIGTYKVEITIDGKTYNTFLNITDTNEPDLVLKDVTIKLGEAYSIDSFIDSCNDLSNDACILSYMDNNMGFYTEEGSYDIIIVAKDTSGNEKEMLAKLNIVKDDINNQVNNVTNNNVTDSKKDNNSSNSNKSGNSGQNNTNNNSTNNSNSSSNNSNNNSGNGSNNNSGNGSNNNSNTTYTQPKTYQVTFILDDGYYTSVIGVLENNTIPSNVETTKEGRSFKEWQLDGKSFDPNTKITGNITLKAVYNDVPVITYKYGVKISTILGRSTYDYSTFNATTDDMRSEASSVAASNMSIYNELLGYVNNLRSEEGKESLVLDNTLSQAATLRAIEIAWSRKFSHTRPNGSSCFTVLDDYNIVAYWVGENIAGGQMTAKSAFDTWNASSGHHENMVGNYTKIGIGKYTLDGATYWVQIFIL